MNATGKAETRAATTSASAPMTAFQWLLILTVAMFWGGSYFFTAVAIRELPPFTIVMARYVVSAPIMICLIILLGQRLPWQAGIWKFGCVLALLNQIVPFSLIAWGQGHIPGAVASILNAVGPIITLVLAHFLTHDDRMTPQRVIGVVLGFAGLVIMIGVSALRAFDVNILAQLACVLATVSYAIANIWARNVYKSGIKPTEVVCAQSVCAGVMLFPLLMVVDQPWTLPLPSVQVWLALLCLGVFSATLGHLIFFKALSLTSATNISLVSYFMPVSAILLGVTFLGETLETRHVIGMCVILAGLAIMDGRLFALLRRMRGN